MIGQVAHWIAWLAMGFFAFALMVWQALNVVDTDPTWSRQNRAWFAVIASLVFTVLVFVLVNWKP